jgi:hypothetical protein
VDDAGDVQQVDEPEQAEQHPTRLTFVYNNQRAICHERAYAGSPYISPGYNAQRKSVLHRIIPEDAVSSEPRILFSIGRADNTATKNSFRSGSRTRSACQQFRRFIHLHVNGGPIKRGRRSRMCSNPVRT